jgi:uncharacterized membrane protein
MLLGIWEERSDGQGQVQCARGTGPWKCVVVILARLALAAVLLVAGVGHFVAAEEFLAQVPPWMPAPQAVVAISGVMELALGVALILARGRYRPVVGWIVAAFFVVVFPGNIWQFIEGRSAFGLDSDAARFIRLFMQPVLVVWALWATGAWSAWRARSNSAQST